MHFRILGPLEVHRRSRCRRLGRQEAACRPRRPPAARERAGQRRAAGARAVGRGGAGGRRPHRAGPRLAAAQGARRRRDRDDDAGRATGCACGPASSTPTASSSWSRTGRRALARGRRRGGGGAAARGAGIWRGPPLADLAFEPFAQTEIARLEEQRLAALELRVEADAAAGRHAELVVRAAAPGGRASRRASGSPASSCSRSTAAGARPRRSTPTARRGASSPTSSASSRARSCARCRRRSCTRIPRSTSSRAEELPARARSGRGARRSSAATPSWSGCASAGRRRAPARGRLVVLAGPRGMGKTRLAAELAVRGPPRAAPRRLRRPARGPAQRVRSTRSRARAAATRPAAARGRRRRSRAGAEVLARVRELPADRALVLAHRDGPARRSPSSSRAACCSSSALGSARHRRDRRPLRARTRRPRVPLEWLLGASGGVPRARPRPREPVGAPRGGASA